MDVSLVSWKQILDTVISDASNIQDSSYLKPLIFRDHLQQCFSTILLLMDSFDSYFTAMGPPSDSMFEKAYYIFIIKYYEELYLKSC